MGFVQSKINNIYLHVLIYNNYRSYVKNLIIISNIYLIAIISRKNMLFLCKNVICRKCIYDNSIYVITTDKVSNDFSRSIQIYT